MLKKSRRSVWVFAKHSRAIAKGAMSGTPQSAWSFGPFLLGLIAITVILTPLFNASRGSLLIVLIASYTT